MSEQGLIKQGVIERFTNADAPENAAAGFRKSGVVLLDGLWSPDRIAAFRSALARGQPQLFERSDAGLGGAQHVGDDRFVVPLALTAETDCLDLILNPPLAGVLNQVLGSDWIFDAIGVIVSWPGASDQHVHRDGPSLFAEAGIDAILPAYAVTVSIPLQDNDALAGATAFWPGSHRSAVRLIDSQPEAPEAHAGSCVLWNFRIRHRGLGNHSQQPRLLLYLTACRRFWTDSFNFEPGRNSKLLIDAGLLANLPEDQRARFWRAETL
ncbi:MAG: phytanoyl-CoA dioxygenase family protein [Novosphingobium sp.]